MSKEIIVTDKTLLRIMKWLQTMNRPLRALVVTTSLFVFLGAFFGLLWASYLLFGEITLIFELIFIVFYIWVIIVI